jgi:Skp family chaperone for outer membrane proteins
MPTNFHRFLFFVDKPGYFRYYYYMQKKMKKSSIGLMLLLLFLLLTFATTSRAQTGFTQKDRDILIQLQTKVDEMEKRFDQRFEQVDKRFSEMREDMNNRFGEMMTYIGILAAIFAAMTVGTISFAFWDRKTMIRPFETKVSELDKKIAANQEKYENLIPVLKEYASKNKKFADIIKQYNLF